LERRHESFWKSFVEGAILAATATADSTRTRGAIEQVEQLLRETLAKEGTILVCGNGGSACDAEELTGLSETRPVSSVVSLLDTGLMTCIANDYGYDQIFARTVHSLRPEVDLLVAISTSGNSPNILNALRAAKMRKIKTIFVGSARLGQALELADISLIAESNLTERSQEVHHIFLGGISSWIRNYEQVNHGN
jgi:D-sedoheptulose 7-phosphate isomerase